MADSIDYPSEVFRLVLASGFYHPEAGARDEFRALLDEWMSSLSGMPAAKEVRELIISEKGTTIEPFILEESDLECAVVLVRAAFSEEIGEHRVRLVSRDTIGRDGGLVITSSLASYYVTRHPHNECRRQTKSGWCFTPAIIPKAASAGPAMTTAVLRAEDNGFRITVALQDCHQNPADFARQLQLGSKIYGLNDSFDQIGLRVECRHGEIHVLSGKPESMIRCMAHMAEGSTMVLDGISNHIPRVLVRLDLPGEKPVPLRAIIGSTPEYLSWFTGNVPVPLSLKNPQKHAIARWLRPPKKWLASINETSP